MQHNYFKLAFAAAALLAGTNVMAIEKVDDVYQISTGAELKEFADLVNGGESDAKAVLTADVDLAGVDFTPITLFTGTLDGQGYTIHNFEYTTTAATQGFIGRLMGGTVQNIGVDGTLNATFGETGFIGYADVQGGVQSLVRNVNCNLDVNVENNGHCGGVVGSSRMVWIDQCTYSGTFTIIHEKGDSDGGIAGYASTGLITNNLFTGRIVLTGAGNNCGGILGYVNSGNFQGLNGNLSIGTIEGGSSSRIAAVAGHINNSTKKEVCFGNYYLEGAHAVGVSGDSSDKGQAVCVSAEQLASGEVAFGLNTYNENPVWKQAIGTDPMPIRTGEAVVYAAGSINCDGTPGSDITYTNTPAEAVQTPHDWTEDGECSVCGAIKLNEDGFFEVTTAAQLRHIAELVNNGKLAEINIRLANDIDLGDENWTPMGNDNKKYSGEFNGQGHTISNMIVDHAEAGAGFFGTVEKGYIHDLIIDESCSVKGTKYSGGLIGHSYGGFTVNIERVGVLCNVTCTGEAAAGIIGNANNGSICNISQCFTTGTIVATQDAACFSGWEGNVGAVIKDCWSVSVVEGFQNESRYLARYGGLTMTNCYSVNGTQGTIINEDDVASGRLAFLMNGGSFTNPKWFQTLGEDAYPTWDSTRGVVYEVTEGVYGCITDEASFGTFVQAVTKAEINYTNELVACTALIEQHLAMTTEAQAITDRDEFLAAYGAIKESHKALEASAAAYVLYQQFCDEMFVFIEENPIAGANAALLEAYLTEEAEPSDNFVNGTYAYIMAQHTLTNEELEAETEFVNATLRAAMAEDYQPGTEITSLIVNPSFANGTEGWNLVSGKLSTANVDGVGAAAEAWNTTFEVEQTISGLKPGYYLVTMNGAFRAYSDLTSTYYAAQFFANDMATYLMMENEDAIAKDAAVDGENSHLSGDATDYSLIMGDIEGWVPMGPIGCAYAFKANRYLNQLVVKVTEEGTLKIGAKNPGTGLEKDWTGFGNFRLYFLGAEGEQVENALDRAKVGNTQRAETIAAFAPSVGEDYTKYPNFYQGLKDKMTTLAEEACSTIEEKMQNEANFTALWQEIYDCRKAYVRLVEAAEAAQTVAQGLVDYGYFSPEHTASVTADYNDSWAAFLDGTASIEDVEEFIEKFNTNPLFPESVDGYYQIKTVDDWNIFAMMVNCGHAYASAELQADLDFAEQGMIPIGWNMNDDCAAANDTYVFRGTFLGNGHTISNAVINKPDAIGSGYFGSIGSPATINGLVFDNTCSVVGKDRAGLIGRSTGNGEIYLSCLGNEGTVTSGIAAAGILGNANSGSIGILFDCYSTGNISHPTGESWKDCAQICGWFGTVGAKITNCWSISNVSGHDGMDNIFSRRANDQAVFTNCYSITGDGNRAKVIGAKVVQSGELAYLLNGEQSENVVWYQTIGEDQHPVLNASHQIVYKKDDGTFYNQGEDAIANIRQEMGGRVVVVSMSGELLRKNVDASNALDGLKPGIYVMKGATKAYKVLVK